MEQRYLLGFTSNMTSSVIYEVFDYADSLSYVRPAEYSKDAKEADLVHFRGSTNLVPFHTFLLGVGHRRLKKKYFLYWYAICPCPPYIPIAQSNYFNFRDAEYYSRHNMSDVRTSFALGLAVEGDIVYVSWSENDSNPLLSAWDSSRVDNALVNSSRMPLRTNEASSHCCMV
ncbi:hypothetical protein ACHAXA_010386 [Cyclostephanos tholiformis]|uniref:Uncharacterized protein n=1 Tax=Cyclostephanos tholiformis TaxID=382380 RepID=A0ABD3RFV7_9STRA